MKIRTDYVTNSSSSSFIVSKNDITLDTLHAALAEMLSGFYGEPLEEGDYDPENTFAIFSTTEDNPYEDWECGSEQYPNHYVVSNDGDYCSRFDWDIVKAVLTRYGVDYELGYCD